VTKNYNSIRETTSAIGRAEKFFLEGTNKLGANKIKAL